MKVVWRARARADLDSIVAYISRDDRAAAFRVHDRILHMTEFLEDWPDLGRSGRQANLRELVVPRTPYVVIYRRRHSDLVILRVLHGKQRR